MTTRNGGDLVVETLQALGIKDVFGIPGQHALGLFDALSRSSLNFYSSRVENNAAFAADGYARATGNSAALFLSTGPGALTSLAGLQEAYATGVPMIVVSSQIPAAGLGARRKGMLHQLDEQTESVRNVTKYQATVQQAAAIPSVLEDAYREAMTAPQGPVWVEVPQDILLESQDTAHGLPAITAATTAAEINQPEAHHALVSRAAELINANSTVIVAGGGVRRSGAGELLVQLAEKIDAPVVCTVGGNTALPLDHPLAVHFIEDRHVTDLMDSAETLLVLGSSLGEVTSNYFTMKPTGTIIQVDAESKVLSSNHPSLGIRADISTFLARLLPAVDTATHAGADKRAEVNTKVAERMSELGLEHEQQVMDAIREAVPDDMQTYWDMTIAAYWAWNVWDAKDGEFHSAQGAGGLGYGFPAALGGALGLGKRTFALAGDGSSLYSTSELAAAVQHDIPVTWLIVDDGGYGILREYMDEAFGKATATELARPDFVKLAESFGVPAFRAEKETLQEVLSQALNAESGPNVVVLETHLKMWELT
ncbi:MAG: thiamine pyrophosphate-binding protein [Corynebacterium casei]|uniref:thiamine pyrophosphate-binding protein n=1 Tax=Corynebacterium casei TaxID=160386 RepID=UPI0009D07D88|nr:thiamine pyrophosphate-binding protein [Corynebacterium casei]MDN5729683.1 thiamine pyrophosphate-binding protein [Corynebacterium casei]SLM92627.1 Acetolactate synthase large subunit [Corynebacterium casei]